MTLTLTLSLSGDLLLIQVEDIPSYLRVRLDNLYVMSFITVMTLRLRTEHLVELRNSDELSRVALGC